MANHRKSLSRYFPAYHLKSGQPTYFVEKVCESISPFGQNLRDVEIYFVDLNKKGIADGNIDLLCEFTDRVMWQNEFEPKHHTIRSIGKRPVKVGDTIQFYVWSGKPYGKGTNQIVVTPPIEVKQVWDFEMKVDEDGGCIPYINGQEIGADTLASIARTDGLSYVDMLRWFKYPKPTGPCQIICWSDKISY